MAALDENLRTELAAIAAAAAGTAVPVEQNKVSEETAKALRIWYHRSSDDPQTLLSGDATVRETHYDVEVQGPDVAAVETLASAILATTTGLNGKRGTFGADTVLGVFVEDQDDDYEYGGFDTDEGWHAAALDVQIFS